MPFAAPDHYEDLYEFPQYKGEDFYFVRIWQNPTNRARYITATFRYRNGIVQRFHHADGWVVTRPYTNSDEASTAQHVVYIRPAQPV